MRQGLLLALAVAAVVALAVVYGRQAMRPPPPDIIDGVSGWLYPGWDRPVDDEAGAARQGVKLAVEADRRLKALGVRPILLLLPLKVRIVPEHLTPSRRAQIETSRGYDELVRGLRAQGVEVFDAAPILSATQRATGKAYAPRDAHWTGQAAEQVAAALARTIQAEGHLTGAPGDGEPLGPWRVVRRYADLVAIQRRKGDLRFAEDDFILREYTAPAVGPAAVAVVGSSFVDRQYGLPQMLSHLLDRRVGHHIKYGADGCWGAMVDYLSLAPRDSARVVVWHLGEGSFSSKASQAAIAAYLKAPPPAF